jgi:nicotinamide mononucleotide transporter
VDALNQVAFHLWGAGVTWAEVVGDVSGALCVWLVARQHIANWPLGLVNNVFWCLLFWRAKLYADSALQIVFFTLGVYGWWMWVFGGSAGRNSLPVRRTTTMEWIWLGAATLAATAIVTYVLGNHTDSPVPLWDASVLTLSLAATYGQTQKTIESWWLWIAVDVISVPLYISRHLYPTAVLYVIFGLICVKGLIDWQRSLGGARLAQPTSA